MRDRSKNGGGEWHPMVAGFWWEWSDPKEESTLVADVMFDDYVRPWNAKSKGRVAEGIPPEALWATHSGEINQVGCINTSQGFEFDYVVRFVRGRVAGGA